MEDLAGGTTVCCWHLHGHHIASLGIAHNGKLADSSSLGSGSLFLGTEYLLIDTTCYLCSKAMFNVTIYFCCLIYVAKKFFRVFNQRV